MNPEDRAAIIGLARELRLDPLQLGAMFSFESAGTFSPTIMGGDSGAYRGLIQFSPSNQRKYGIRGNQSIAQQIPAIRQYLLDRGFKPGQHNIGHAYSAVLAGRADEKYWDRKDSNGTSVRSSLPKFMPGGSHYANAAKRLGTDVRMAGTGELPQQMRVPGDPRTGRAMYPGVEVMGNGIPIPQVPGMEAALSYEAQMLAEQMRRQREPSLAQRMAQDPWIQSGLATLATPTGLGNPVSRIASGIQQGFERASVAEQAQMKMDAALSQMFIEHQDRQRKAQIQGETDAAAMQINDDVMRALFRSNPAAYATIAAAQGGAMADARALEMEMGGGGYGYQQPPMSGAQGAPTGVGPMPEQPMPGGMPAGGPQMPSEMPQEPPQVPSGPAPLPGQQEAPQMPPGPAQGPQAQPAPPGAPGMQPGAPQGVPGAAPPQQPPATSGVPVQDENWQPNYPWDNAPMPSDQMLPQVQRARAVLEANPGSEYAMDQYQAINQAYQQARAQDIADRNKRSMDIQSPDRIMDAATKVDTKMRTINDGLQAAERIIVSLDSNTPLGDVAAITGFAKLLDPGSVVRPAEAENVERAQGLYAQLQMHIRSLTEKRSLSQEAQNEMRRLTHELASIYVDWGNKNYDQLARTYGNVYRYEDIGLRKPSYRGQPEQVTEGEKASNAAQGIPLEGMSREEVLERVRNIPGAPKPPPAFGTWWDSNVGW